MLNKYLLTQLNDSPQARVQMEEIMYEWCKCADVGLLRKVYL